MTRLGRHAALCLTLAFATAVSCSKAPGNRHAPASDPAVPVTVGTVTAVPVDRTLPVVGTLYAKDEATVAAEVEGRVERTLVDFGDRVTSGQLLAEIDTQSYGALARQADANVARARAAAANAEQNLRRLQELQKEKIASASELDQALAEAEKARAEVKAAEAAAAIADLNLERSKVKAPFDAAVAERVASAGDFMRVGSPLFRVVNDGVLKFIFQVPEAYAGQVQKDQPVTFSVYAWPEQPFEGKVYLISPQVSTTTRAFNVGALVQNPDRQLKANTAASGELVLARAVPTLMVPLDAVVVFAGVTKVFVLESGVARSRAVEAGRVRGDQQEILSGLKAGDAVVVSGQTKLFDGTKVKEK
jgi:membrane fusion protein (multidrug efflux system)